MEVISGRAFNYLSKSSLRVEMAEMARAPILLPSIFFYLSYPLPCSIQFSIALFMSDFLIDVTVTLVYGIIVSTWF